MDEKHINIPAIEIKQPIGTFYIARIDAVDLLNISFSDIRRIESETDNILGIQRELSPKRIKDLEKYVKYKDATFPTSIILSINSDRLVATDNPEEMNTDEEVVIEYVGNRLRILNERYVAKIIDGYHRIAGLDTKKWNREEFELNVTIFVDMDPEDEAIVFATINKQQTKPSNSLAYDLFELAKSRSPQKTCHNIARLFNRESDNPFYKKIKLLGKSFYGSETISQATFVEAMMSHISSDPMKDRDDLKRGKQIELKPRDLEKHVFRILFKEEKDPIIAKNISNYFDAVRGKWNSAWDTKTPDMILNRTTGFISLMRFFKWCYINSAKNEDGIVTTAAFTEIFDKIQIDSNDFTKNYYKPGGSGISQLYHDLLRGKKESKSTFV